MNLFKSRFFRQGSVATVITVLVIVLVVIINMIATILSSRYALGLDMTEGRIFTLSKESLEFLRTLEKDVAVYLLADEQTFIDQGVYYQQAVEVIRRYETQSPHISVQFVNIVRDPTFVTRFPDLKLNIGNVLVTHGDRAVILTAYELFNTEMDYDNQSVAITSSKAEQAFSSAILNVTSEKQFTISILTGHDEFPVTDFANLLRTNNFKVITQNLVTEEIDPEATIAVLCAPSRDISEQAAARLDRFLNNNEQLGKTLFYMASVAQPEKMPVLDAFLEEWGIRVLPGTIYDNNNSNLFVLGNGFATITLYNEEEYSKNVMAKKQYMAVAYARPFEFVYEEQANSSTSALLAFPASIGIRPSDAPADWQPNPAMAVGLMPAMAMNKLTKYEGTRPYFSTLLFAGTEAIVAGDILGSSQFGNSEYLLTLFNALSGRDETVAIQNKTVSRTELGITGAQVYTLAVILVIVFPLTVLVLGIVFWLVRRHK